MSLQGLRISRREAALRARGGASPMGEIPHGWGFTDASDCGTSEGSGRTPAKGYVGLEDGNAAMTGVREEFGLGRGGS